MLRKKFSFCPYLEQVASAIFLIACVASVSVRFRSKERGTRVKDRAKNGVSKRAGRGGEERKETSFLSPSPHFHFLALVSFLARPKLRILFLGLSLLRNLRETLATQAIFLTIQMQHKVHSVAPCSCRKVEIIEQK